MPFFRVLFATSFCLTAVAELPADEPIRVVIVDGRNNHEWGSTTHALRQMLLQTGRFSVDLSTAPVAYPAPRPRRPSKPTDEEARVYEAAMAEYQTAAKEYEASIAGEWEKWRPKFANYDVVVDNYNGPEWLLPVKADLVEFIQNGGGMVVIHGANNAFMRRSGLNFNIHHGRIYRVTKRRSASHEDFRPGVTDQDSRRVSIPKSVPRLLDTPTAQLPQYLEHDNGWIRDTTQKLIVLREDRDAVRFELERMATFHARPLARLHALWTLEGCDAIDEALLTSALNDDDWRIREAAVRISEPFLIANNASIWSHFERLANDADPNVARQVILSLGHCDKPRAIELIDAVIERHLTNEVVFLSAMTSLYNRRTPMIERILDGSAFRTIKDSGVRVNTQRRWTLGIANWKEQSAPARPLDAEAIKLIEDGYQIYAQLCINCHGSDGRGVQMPGQPEKAPPLVGSPRVLGQKEVLARIVLHGLTGPVDAKTYREVMAPSDKHEDKWVASVLSYIRQDWGNLASVIRPAEVARIRSASRGRYRAWTMKELASYALPEITDRAAWKADSSSGKDSAARAINGQPDSCDNPNKPGRWFQLDLGELHTVTALQLTSANNDRYPREWQLTLSSDGEIWSDPICTGKGESATTLVSMEPVVGRYFKVTQTGQDSHHRWSIIDVKVFGTAGDVRTWAPSSPAEKPLTVEQLSVLNGDAAKGASVFAKTCVKCHVINGKGTTFGPDLSKVGSRLQKPQIVQSILDPDAVVDLKHRGEMIITSAGKLLSGFIVAETAESVSIRTSDNVVHKVLAADIDGRKRLDKSFMPSGLDRTMTRQDLLDLIEFLTERR